MELERAGLDGNSGKPAERMVVKSANRSRNGSDLYLRQPHNPEAVGSNPPPAKVLSGQDEIEKFLAYLRGDASTLLVAADLDGDETTFRCVPPS